MGGSAGLYVSGAAANNCCSFVHVFQQSRLDQHALSICYSSAVRSWSEGSVVCPDFHSILLADFRMSSKKRHGLTGRVLSERIGISVSIGEKRRCWSCSFFPRCGIGTIC